MYTYAFSEPKYITDYTMYVNQILKRKHRRKMKKGKSRR